VFLYQYIGKIINSLIRSECPPQSLISIFDKTLFVFSVGDLYRESVLLLVAKPIYVKHVLIGCWGVSRRK